jgi:hypothetical protein
LLCLRHDLLCARLDKRLAFLDGLKLHQNAFLAQQSATGSLG